MFRDYLFAVRSAGRRVRMCDCNLSVAYVLSVPRWALRDCAVIRREGNCQKSRREATAGPDAPTGTKNFLPRQHAKRKASLASLDCLCAMLPIMNCSTAWHCAPERNLWASDVAEVEPFTQSLSTCSGKRSAKQAWSAPGGFACTARRSRRYPVSRGERAVSGTVIDYNQYHAGEFPDRSIWLILETYLRLTSIRSRFSPHKLPHQFRHASCSTAAPTCGGFRHYSGHASLSTTSKSIPT